jgi:hypothetical protein
MHPRHLLILDELARTLIPGLISFEISKNRYGNLKVNSVAVSKLMTFAVELRALQHQNGEQEEGDTVPEGA